ncbi:MAG: ABC-2 family transporter protein, partial [Dehalococcoidales bacterium]|nr:ABC-2 family transporter protein [Dehalococcoidales bacterium]
QIKNVFKQNLSYRTDYILNIINSLLWLIVNVYIWQALMGAKGGVSTSAGTISFQQMVTYTVISSVISAVIGNNITNIIDERIRSGDIAMDLVKPVSFQGLMFSSNIGETIFRLAFRTLPVLIIGFALYHISLPTMSNFLFFCVSLAGSVLMYFIFRFIIALVAFWYPAPTWHWVWILDLAIDIFAGAFIPLWFFPSAIVKFADFLPFKLIYYVPISIYLGRYEIHEIPLLILQQIMWLAVLYGGMALMWKQAVRKLTIQGG